MSRHAHVKRAKILRASAFNFSMKAGSDAVWVSRKIEDRFQSGYARRIRCPTSRLRNLAHAIRGGYHS